MSFKQKELDRSVNTSGADDRAPENKREMSFKLLRKYFDKMFEKQNKKMESNLHSDARQTEKKLKVFKPEQEIDFKFKGNKTQHQLNVKLVINFLICSLGHIRIWSEYRKIQTRKYSVFFMLFTQCWGSLASPHCKSSHQTGQSISTTDPANRNEHLSPI